MVLFFIVLIMLASIVGISSDIYSPSIPDIAQIMQTNINHVQLTMPMFMLGCFLSMLICSFILDIYGRKYPLIISLSVFILANIMTTFVGDLTGLLMVRFLQGISAGVAGCAWRALFRDKFSGAAMSRYAGYCSIAFAFVVPSAPYLGGILHEHFSWHASFYFMAIYGLATLIMVAMFIEDSLPKLKFRVVTENFAKLMKSSVFWGYSCLSFTYFGAAFSWFVIGPALIIHTLKYSPSFFGLINFLVAGLGILIGGYLNGKFVERHGIDKILTIGSVLALIAGVLELTLYYIFGTNLIAIYLPIFILQLGLALIFSNVFSKFIAPFPASAGTAASLYAALQILGSVLFGAVAAYLPDSSQIYYALLIITLIFSAIGLRYFIDKVNCN